MSLDKKHIPGRKRENPHKPKRNLKDYIKFVSIAVILLFLVDYMLLKGERPHITKMKEAYYANQEAQEKAFEEALPPEVVFPENGEEYFEAPHELNLKDEQSLLREKRFNITKLTVEEEVPLPARKAKRKPEKATPSYKYKNDRPKIAIVIDDVGMNIKQSRAAINLPSEVTLAMLPYASSVKSLAKDARKKGHELIIHTPMEAMDKDQPLGSMALRSGMEAKAFKAEFNKIANSFEGYVGVNNHMGSRLTQDDKAMQILMEELSKRGLFFLDSKTIGTSIAADMASKHNIPNATRDVFLDHESSPEFIQNALKQAEHIARKNGSAIAIGHPKAITMAALKKWIPEAKRRGIDIVPLSRLIQPAKSKNMLVNKASIETTSTDKKVIVLNMTPTTAAPIKTAMPVVSYPVD